MPSGPWNPADPVEAREVLAEEVAVEQGAMLAMERQKLQGPGRREPGS